MMKSIQPVVRSSDDAKLEILSEKTVVQVESNQSVESFCYSENYHQPYLPDEKTVVLNNLSKNSHRIKEGDEFTCVSVDDEGLYDEGLYAEGRRTDVNAASFNVDENVSGAGKKVIKDNVLVSSAMPLIHYAMSLTEIGELTDIGAIRSRLISDIGRFQNQAEQSIADQRQVLAARYLLCSFIDEIVATTPWGLSHHWGSESLLSYFHNETYGGDGFFALLERAEQAPMQYLELLELMYVCLSLGFAGRYRIDGNGSTKLEGVRESVMAAISKCRGPDNSSLVIGEVAPRTVEKRDFWWLAPIVIGILLLGNGLGYLGLSNEVEARMETASTYVLGNVDKSN